MRTEADIRLDRIEIEEAGPNPVKLAAAIHDQLDNERGPVPVQAIARALDIQEIRIEPLDNLEGALITRPERGYGSILVNGNSNRQRQRFTIAHELGHFLNPWHVPADGGGFRCSRDDIRTGEWRIKASPTRHDRQETEANRFAIELLLPRARLHDALSAVPDLQPVLSAAQACDVSRAAAARRYVELQDATIAIAFSQNGKLRYWAKRPGFPATAIRRDDPLRDLPKASAGARLSDLEDADPADWLAQSDDATVTVQTLYQRDGFAMTLVIVDAGPDETDEDDGIEDAFSRFSKF